MPSFDKPLRCPPFDGLIVEFYVPSKIRPQTARYVLPKRLATSHFNKENQDASTLFAE